MVTMDQNYGQGGSTGHNPTNEDVSNGSALPQTPGPLQV